MARPKSAAKPAAAPERAKHRFIVPAILAVLVAMNVVGADYYAAPMAERVRHPLHEYLRPSGYIGQSAGVLAFLIFTFLWLYPLRKKFKKLAFLGSVGRWLDVHVTTALSLPLLLAIHAAWKFDGIIGLGYGAILLVCLSGVVGRYLYTRIPRTKSGVELTLDEVTFQRAALIERIAATTRIDRAVVAQSLEVAVPKRNEAGIGRTLWELVAADLLRWRRVRELRSRWLVLAPAGNRPSRQALKDAATLASREMGLAQQVRMLEATHRVFRWWHVAHRPVALTALVAVVLHTTIVIALGATWFW